VSQKFAGHFFYKQNCDGEVLEVHHSEDETVPMVTAKRMMAVSFFQDTQYESQIDPVSAISTTKEWEDSFREDLDEEDGASQQKPKLPLVKFAIQDVQDESKDVQDDEEDNSMDMQGDEHVIYDEHKSDQKEDQEASSKIHGSTKSAKQNSVMKFYLGLFSEVDISEAKQAVEPTSSKCKKSSDALNAKGDKQGKPSSQGTQICAWEAVKPRCSRRASSLT